MENLGYKINTKVSGKVVAIKPFNDNANKKGAQLQFANIDAKGLSTIDVKVEAAREDMLQKFLNQNVIINNVNVVKVDFNTYYSAPDITCVSIDSKLNMSDSKKGA